MKTGFAADAHLPARDTLLDPNLMPQILGRLMGPDGPVAIEAYRNERAKYRIGESLRLLHRFTVAGEAKLVASRTYAMGAAPPRETIDRYRGRVVDGLNAVVFDPQLHTAFWTFPVDRKLTRLAELLDGGDHLAALVGHPVTIQLVQFAPEKSATVVCHRPHGSAPIAYVKAYRDDTHGDVAERIHRELPGTVAAGCRHLEMPRMLGYDRERRFLALAAVDGTRLDQIPDDRREEPMRLLGSAVAELHALRAPEGTPTFGRLDIDKILHAAELIGLVRPDVAPAARSLAATLARSQPPPPATPSCLHGDLHLKNAFLRDGRVVLIDLDLVGAGDPAAEIGSLLAALRFTAVAGRSEREAAHAQERAFLDGYGSLRALPGAPSIRWHVAAALLTERALRVVNRIRVDGLATLAALVEEAETELGAVAA